MDDNKNIQPYSFCQAEIKTIAQVRDCLTDVAEAIVDSCKDNSCPTNVDFEPIPSQKAIIHFIQSMKEMVFPGYFNIKKMDWANLKYNIGQEVFSLFEILAEQISLSIRHECNKFRLPCSACIEKGHSIAFHFFQCLPGIKQMIAKDLKATFDGDPAAKCYDEIVISYPGLFAIMVYRLAHQLWQQKVTLIPRIMTEYAHSTTGIDIHPGAQIGESFMIDHGTGIVIGETTQIGKNVRIYQGVTIGALSLPKHINQEIRHKKRHPTIEDDVVIYSGATLLGGETVIGARSIIGGNVWLTESIPPDTKVILEKPQLKYLKNHQT